MFDTDEEIFSFIHEKLYVAAVCDILDSLGFRQQAMHQRIRPLLPDMRRCGFVGRARTIRWMDTDYVVEADPYGLEIEAMDSLKPGDVVIHSTRLRRHQRALGRADVHHRQAQRRGRLRLRQPDPRLRAHHRDGLPGLLHRHPPAGQPGAARRVMAYDVPVRCGDVLVHPGELVFADYDGVVAIPRPVEKDVLTLALEKVGKETASRQALLEGKSLREVYAIRMVMEMPFVT